jgi:inorganic pyrophosphatase
MEDEKGEDSKILTVPTGDPRFTKIKDLGDVVPHRLKEIEEFFEI